MRFLPVELLLTGVTIYKFYTVTCWLSLTHSPHVLLTAGVSSPKINFSINSEFRITTLIVIVIFIVVVIIIIVVVINFTICLRLAILVRINNLSRSHLLNKIHPPLPFFHLLSFLLGRHYSGIIPSSSTLKKEGKRFLFPDNSKRLPQDHNLAIDARSKQSTSKAVLTQKLSSSPGSSQFKNIAHGQWSYVPSSLINRKDILGRTLLHKLATSENESEAMSWLGILSKHPLLQPNITDHESGWTPLHRALYHGNLRFAKALISELGCELSIKDHEGLSAFDLYSLTIDGTWPSTFLDGSLSQFCQTDLFTWGSNRNFVLGLHDDGDRSYPERIHLKRLANCSSNPTKSSSLPSVNPFSSDPVHVVVMSRLHTALILPNGELRVCGFGSGGRLGLSNNHISNGAVVDTQFTFATVKSGGLSDKKVRSVALGQDHTVVITSDGQVYTFGSNRFGQLGYGPDSPGVSLESMVQDVPKRVAGLLKRSIVIGAAASRWHTAVFTSDALYTWGAHKGQLGYHGSSVGPQMTFIQSTPRRVTSVTAPIVQITCTNYATAYLCKDACDVFVLRSDTSVRVTFGFDRFPSGIQVSAPPSSAPNQSRLTRITEISASDNMLIALTSMGDVFTVELENLSVLDSNALSAAIPSSPHRQGLPLTSAASVSHPRRIWTSNKLSTAVRSAAIGNNGTVILSTVSGHVYIGTIRTEANGVSKGFESRTSDHPIASAKKNYKFYKLPYLQRVLRVAANPTGSYAAIREDVLLKNINFTSPEETFNLPSALSSMLVHLKKYASSTPQLHDVPFLLPTVKKASFCSETTGLQTLESDSEDLDTHSEFDLAWDICAGCVLFELSLHWACHQKRESLTEGDIIIVAESGEQILVHKFVLCSRSHTLDQIINCQYSVDDINYHLTYKPSQEDQICFELPALCFRRFSLLTCLLFIHYLYTDTFPSIWDGRVWPQIESLLKEWLKNSALCEDTSSFIYVLNETKAGLRELARLAKLPDLEQSLNRVGKSTPKPSLAHHFQNVLDMLEVRKALPQAASILSDSPDSFQGCSSSVVQSANLRPDIELELKNGEILYCHSLLMRAQCPFFRLMFDQDAWLAQRRQLESSAHSGCIRIDMSHLDKKAIKVVLQHIYTDDRDNLFVAQDFDSLDGYIDFIFDVLAAANELMMDKLKLICSNALRNCINLTNVTAIAMDADFYCANSLKEVCMNYMVRNVETIFQDKGLIDIPTELLSTISNYLKRLQAYRSPISRSPQIFANHMSRYSQLLSELDLPPTKVGRQPRQWKSFIKSHSSSTQTAMTLNGHDNLSRMSPGDVTLRRDDFGNTSPSSSPSHRDSFADQSGSCSKVHKGHLGGTPRNNAQVGLNPQALGPVSEIQDDGAPFTMDDLNDIAVLRPKKEESCGANNINRLPWVIPAKKPPVVDLRTIMSAEKLYSGGAHNTSNLVADNSGSIQHRLPASLTVNPKLSQRDRRRLSHEVFKATTEAAHLSSAIFPAKPLAWKPGATVNWRCPESSKNSGPLESSSICPSGLSFDSKPRVPQRASPDTNKNLGTVITGQANSKPPSSVASSSNLITKLSLTKKPERSDPASAVGAAVITPTRALPQSNNTSINTMVSPRRNFSSQDSPWTNYVSTSTNPLYTAHLNANLRQFSGVVDSEGVCNSENQQIPSPEASGNPNINFKTSFSAIQHQQATESWALREKPKPNFIKIQEEENIRQQEKKQEEQFLKWFEDESKRLKQAQKQPKPQSGPKSPGKKVTGGRKEKRNNSNKGFGGPSQSNQPIEDGEDLSARNKQPSEAVTNRSSEPSSKASYSSKRGKRKTDDSKLIQLASGSPRVKAN
ncbi:hypothetical protein O181_017166 [Austropuccinia psidii MF-1]|uniref:BTB domain-containing protein n=1 Tax=Austropuccinia psidii MF-1 TaxID=1389203 RepID=A0A9Q3C2Z5_9BASI|nr:hypothetical protein [Austropuccinia psidii MF-1]